MPRPAHIDPSAYAADGGAVGVLLVHGVGGSAAEMRPMGEYLAERGLTVRCPLLSGHGTVPEDLIGIRWQTWAEEVELALYDLQSGCETVFYCGLSLGSLLGLSLSPAHPEIAGLVLLSPAIRLRNRLIGLTLGLRYLLRFVPAWALEQEFLSDPEARHRHWCYDQQSVSAGAEFYLLQRHLRTVLASVRQPVLIMQGRLDNWLAPDDGQIVYDGVASADKTLLWMEHSGHNMLVDGEREEVWARSFTWMMRVLGDAG